MVFILLISAKQILVIIKTLIDKPILQQAAKKGHSTPPTAGKSEHG